MPDPRFGSSVMTKQVVVVLHEAVRQTPPCARARHAAEKSHEGAPILVVQKHPPATIAPGCHVMDAAGELAAGRSCGTP